MSTPKLDKVSGLDEEILIVLRSQRLYGGDIKRALAAAHGEKIGDGTLYPALHRLVKRGFLSSEWGQDTEKTEGARRKYYKLTACGSEVLSRARARKQYLESWKPETVFGIEQQPAELLDTLAWGI
jgi:PadR family transcriptional regulator, regulatory protein PadR